jgi:hypothetical protein
LGKKSRTEKGDVRVSRVGGRSRPPWRRGNDFAGYGAAAFSTFCARTQSLTRAQYGGLRAKFAGVDIVEIKGLTERTVRFIKQKLNRDRDKQES